MRFGSTAKVLLKCKYYRISECVAEVTRCHAKGMPKLRL